MDQGIDRSPTDSPSAAGSRLRLLALALGATAGGVLLSLALGASPASAAAQDDLPVTPDVVAAAPLAAPVLDVVGTVLTDAVVADAVQPIADAVVQPVVEPLVAAVAPAPPAAAAPAIAAAVPAVVAHTTTLLDSTLAAVGTAPLLGATPTATLLAPTADVLGGALHTALGTAFSTLTGVVGPVAGSALVQGDHFGTATVETRAAAASDLPSSPTATAGTASALVLDAPAAPVAPSPRRGDVPMLSAGSPLGAPTALLAGVVLTLALAIGRLRTSGDAVPASPVFATDSSPD